jgi:DNA-binding MarR family transcriptional regulator
MRRTHKAEPALKLQDPRWSLLTPHALVLLCIARAPDTRVRDIAEFVGISERGAHQIVADLVSARYVQRTRVGRRNRYAIEEKTALKHVPLRHRRVASIIALLGPEPAGSERAAKAVRARIATNGSNGVNGHARPSRSVAAKNGNGARRRSASAGSAARA